MPSRERRGEREREGKGYGVVSAAFARPVVGEVALWGDHHILYFFTVLFIMS